MTRAERLARLRGQVEAARATAAAARDEGGRLAEALAQARTRAEHAQLQYGQVQDLASGRERGRSELAAAHEQATAALAAASARVAEQRKAEHQASGARAALRARAETLTEAVKRGADATGLLLSGESQFSGVVGAFAALLTVEDGAGEAIATALGAAAGAVAVSGLDAAAEILAGLKDADAGRADLVIAAPPNGHGPGGSPPRTTAPGPLPDGVRLAADLVKAPGEFAPAVAGLLDGVAVAPDLAQAREVLRRHPGLRVVTLDGDLLGAHWARGGTAGPQSLIGLRAAAAEATTGLREADLACQHAERQLAEASDEEARARQAAAEALAGLQEADAAAAEISGRLGTLAGAAKAATDEASRLAARIAAAGRGQEKDQARLAELEHQLEQADAEADAARADQTAADLTPAQARAERERLAGLAAAARDTEMDCRLEVRTAEERLRAITGRADSLTAAAATERQARERALARAKRRAREAALAQAVAAGASAAVVADHRVAGRGRRRTAGRRGGQPGPRRPAQGGPRPDPAAGRRAGQGRRHRARRGDRPGRPADAARAARHPGGRGVRGRGGRAGRRVRARGAASLRATTTRCRCPTTGPRRRSGRSPRSGCSTSSARSTRWPWRSSRRWRSGTRSWSPSSRTSRRPAATC